MQLICAEIYGSSLWRVQYCSSTTAVYSRYSVQYFPVATGARARRLRGRASLHIEESGAPRNHGNTSRAWAPVLVSAQSRIRRNAAAWSSEPPRAYVERIRMTSRCPYANLIQTPLNGRRIGMNKPIVQRRHDCLPRAPLPLSDRKTGQLNRSASRQRFSLPFLRAINRTQRDADFLGSGVRRHPAFDQAECAGNFCGLASAHV